MTRYAPKIKICGLFRPQDIQAANRARPDYIGFVFAKSPRQVNFDTARRLRAELEPGIVPVGVFVDEAPEMIRKLAEAGVIQAVQLHGQEDAAYILRLKQIVDIPVIKAARIRTRSDIDKLTGFPADILLPDGGSGGAGEAFDWDILPEIGRPWILSGGIHAGNLQSALRRRPFAVDISSGAETDGLKDPGKIIALTRAVRDFTEGTV